MSKEEEKYISVTVTLPKEYVDFLLQFMRQKDLNRSQVVRMALRELMTKGGK